MLSIATATTAAEAVGKRDEKAPDESSLAGGFFVSFWITNRYQTLRNKKNNSWIKDEIFAQTSLSGVTSTDFAVVTPN